MGVAWIEEDMTFDDVVRAVREVRRELASERFPRTARVVLNDDLEWTRGKRSAHAVHAVLRIVGHNYAHPVLVLNAKRREIEGDCPHIIRGREGMPLAGAYFDTRGGELRLVVRVDFDRSGDRDGTARLAVSAALLAVGITGIDFEIRSGTVTEALDCPTVIRDHGRTELKPGTITAGADVS
jgi:peptidyl-tRNA hydrolase